MYSSTPPVPPPKPGSHDVSRIGTPATTQTPRPPPLPDAMARGGGGSGGEGTYGQGTSYPEATGGGRTAQAEPIPDPGDSWLPEYLEEMQKQDLAALLASPSLLTVLTHSPKTAHPSLTASHAALRRGLTENAELAQHLSSLASHLSSQRAAVQAQLLSCRALERAWHAKQREVDASLAPFAPENLYVRLAQAVQEQGQLCEAMEESFLSHQQQQQQGVGGGGGGGKRRSLHAQAALDGGGGGGGDGRDEGVEYGGGKRDDGDDGPATEREVLDWVGRYREARKLLYLRQERKDRWDEGRVGGWR